MADCSIGSCAPGTGARLDAVHDRLTGINSCKQSITASPQLIALKGAISLGGIAGDWETVRLLFAADNEHMPPGTRVLGSNGNVYKLIGDDNVDPTTDSGTNWVSMASDPLAGMEEAAKAGAPLGDWAKAKAAYAAVGKKIPVGAYVLGSDGVLYKLVGDPDVDPTTDDGTNWKPATQTLAALDEEIALGGVLGDWDKVKALLAAHGRKIPAGAFVIGSDGVLYQLVGGNPDADPTTDNGANWKAIAPALADILGAINTGAPAGDWAKVLAAMTAANKPIPAGTIVIGSDGSLYKLIGDATIDPTTDDGSNWVNLTLTAHTYQQLTF